MLSLYTQSLELESGPMTARNNSKSVTFFKSVSQFDSVLRISQMLIKEDTPSSIIYRVLVSVVPSLPGFRFRIPIQFPDSGFRLFHTPAAIARRKFFLSQ